MHYFISTAIDPKPFQKAIHKDIHKDTKSIPTLQSEGSVTLIPEIKKQA